MALKASEKRSLIARLIANEGVGEPGPWSEDDKLALNAIPDDKLEALDRQRELAANAEMADDVEEEEMPPPKKRKKVKMARNAGDPDPDDEDDEDDEDDDHTGTHNRSSTNNNRLAPKPMTEAEWMATAPDRIRSAVQNAVNFENSQKTVLIETIVKNERNEYERKELERMDLPNLQKLAKLCSNEEPGRQNPNALSSIFPSFIAQGGAFPMVQNLGSDFVKEDMDMAPEDTYDYSQRD